MDLHSEQRAPANAASAMEELYVEVDGYKLPFAFSRPPLPETPNIPEMIIPAPTVDVAALASPW